MFIFSWDLETKLMGLWAMAWTIGRGDGDPQRIGPNQTQRRGQRLMGQWHTYSYLCTSGHKFCSVSPNTQRVTFQSRLQPFPSLYITPYFRIFLRIILTRAQYFGFGTLHHFNCELPFAHLFFSFFFFKISF